MNSFRYLIWIAYTIISYAIVTGLQYSLRSKHSWSLRIVVVLLKAIAAVACAYFVVAVNCRPAWNGAFFFASLYVALIGDTVGDIITFPYELIKKTQPNRKTQAVISAACVFLFFLYGTVNMQLVHANHLTVTSEKLNEDHRIVFMSDLHAGSAQSMETVRNTIGRIADEDPELVILGGDITDEYTTKEEMEQVYDLMGSIEAPVYFIYGNHDRQPGYELTGMGRTYSDIEFKECLLKNGIHILEDEWVRVDNDLILLGRDDVSTGTDRVELNKIPEWPDDEYVILLDHSPYSVDDTIATDADLELSGHTHAGQLFPLRIMYDLTGHDAYGFYRHGNTQVYVSAGVAGWAVPFRTQARCQYDVIELKSTQE